MLKFENPYAIGFSEEHISVGITVFRRSFVEALQRKQNLTHFTP